MQSVFHIYGQVIVVYEMWPVTLLRITIKGVTIWAHIMGVLDTSG